MLFDNMVIRPFQEMLLDAFDEILAYNGIKLDLYFQTLKPLEFGTDENSQEVKMSSEEREEKTELELYLDEIGEDITDEWELVDERDVD